MDLIKNIEHYLHQLSIKLNYSSLNKSIDYLAEEIAREHYNNGREEENKEDNK